MSGVEHRLRDEPAEVLAGGGYRALCRCGVPFEGPTLGAAHNLLFEHARSLGGGSATEERWSRELARMAEMAELKARWGQRPEQVAGPYLRQFQVEPHTLEHVIGALDELGRFSRTSVSVERYVAEETGELVAKAVVQVLTDHRPPQRIVESRVVEFWKPASWWEHFKMAYSGRWWMRGVVRRWPVRCEMEERVVEVTVEVERVLAFPKADVRPPTSFGPPVEWWRWKSLAREVTS